VPPATILLFGTFLLHAAFSCGIAPMPLKKLDKTAFRRGGLDFWNVLIVLVAQARHAVK
jgi:hypothetical protein